MLLVHVPLVLQAMASEQVSHGGQSSVVVGFKLASQ
jgi:hypothetical protein